MTLRTSIQLAGATLLVLLAATACSRHTGTLKPWPLPTDPVVFQDTFTGAVVFEAFGNSKLDALSTDTVEQYAGTGCVRVTVPGPGEGYAGGAFTTGRARDLTGYDALTFWAKASRAVTIDVAGLGNDNTGTSRFEAKRSRIPVTTTWTKIVIPIPLPRRLAAERGLFFFAAAPQGGSGYVLWFDEVRFERLGTIPSPRPAMTPRVVNSFVGAITSVTGTRDTFDLDGADQVVEHMPAYFDYTSSDPAVATVTDGMIRIIREGTATITARLDTTLVSGQVTLNSAPFTPGLAPTPTVPSANVISLFSNSYPNRIVDRWSADWDRADVADLQVYGNDMKLYTNLVYAGIEFTSHPIDASLMTHFHIDLWVPTGTNFKVKLVDFGADGVYGGGDDSEQELTFDASTTPPLAIGSWVGLEIPLASFSNLLARAHLAQLVLAGDTPTVYVDNVYFHR